MLDVYDAVVVVDSGPSAVSQDNLLEQNRREMAGQVPRTHRSHHRNRDKTLISIIHRSRLFRLAERAALTLKKTSCYKKLLISHIDDN